MQHLKYISSFVILNQFAITSESGIIEHSQHLLEQIEQKGNKMQTNVKLPFGIIVRKMKARKCFL